MNFKGQKPLHIRLYNNVIELALAHREQVRFWTLVRGFGGPKSHHSFPVGLLYRAHVTQSGLYRQRDHKPIPGGLVCRNIFGRPYSHARRSQLGYIELGLPVAQSWLLRDSSLAYYGVFTGCSRLCLTRLVYAESFIAHYDTTYHPPDLPYFGSQWTFTPWHVDLIQPEGLGQTFGSSSKVEKLHGWKKILDRHHAWLVSANDGTYYNMHDSAPIHLDHQPAMWNSLSWVDTQRALPGGWPSRAQNPQPNPTSHLLSGSDVDSCTNITFRKSGFGLDAARLKPYNFASCNVVFQSLALEKPKAKLWRRRYVGLYRKTPLQPLQDDTSELTRSDFFETMHFRFGLEHAMYNVKALPFEPTSRVFEPAQGDLGYVASDLEQVQSGFQPVKNHTTAHVETSTVWPEVSNPKKKHVGTFIPPGTEERFWFGLESDTSEFDLGPNTGISPVEETFGPTSALLRPERKSFTPFSPGLAGGKGPAALSRKGATDTNGVSSDPKHFKGVLYVFKRMENKAKMHTLHFVWDKKIKPPVTYFWTNSDLPYKYIRTVGRLPMYEGYHLGVVKSIPKGYPESGTLERALNFQHGWISSEAKAEALVLDLEKSPYKGVNHGKKLPRWKRKKGVANLKAHTYDLPSWYDVSEAWFNGPEDDVNGVDSEGFFSLEEQLQRQFDLPPVANASKETVHAFNTPLRPFDWKLRPREDREDRRIQRDQVQLRKSQSLQLLTTGCNGLPYLWPHVGFSLSVSGGQAGTPVYGMQRVQRYTWHKGCNAFFQSGVHFEHEFVPKFETQTGAFMPTHVQPCRWMCLHGLCKTPKLKPQDLKHSGPYYGSNPVLKLFFQNQAQIQNQKSLWRQTYLEQSKWVETFPPMSWSRGNLAELPSEKPIWRASSKRDKQSKLNPTRWKSTKTVKAETVSRLKPRTLRLPSERPYFSRHGRLWAAFSKRGKLLQRYGQPRYRFTGWPWGVGFEPGTFWTERPMLWRYDPLRFRGAYHACYGVKRQKLDASLFGFGTLQGLFRSWFLASHEVQRLRCKLKSCFKTKVAFGRLACFRGDILTLGAFEFQRLALNVSKHARLYVHVTQRQASFPADLLPSARGTFQLWLRQTVWTSGPDYKWIRNWNQIQTHGRSRSLRLKTQRVSLNNLFNAFIHSRPGLVRNRHAVVHNNWIHLLRSRYDAFRKYMLPYTLERTDASLGGPNFALVNYVDRGMTNKTSQCGAGALALGLQSFNLTLPGLHGWKKVSDYEKGSRYFQGQLAPGHINVTPLWTSVDRADDRTYNVQVGDFKVYVSEKSKVGPPWELSLSDTESGSNVEKVKRLQNRVPYTWNSARRPWRRKPRYADFFSGGKIQRHRGRRLHRRYMRKLQKRRVKFLRRYKLLKRLSPNNVGWMVLHRLPVLPADCRPVFQLDNVLATTDLTRLYSNLVYYNQIPLSHNETLMKIFQTFYFQRHMGFPVVNSTYMYRAHEQMKHLFGFQLQNAMDALIDTSKRADFDTYPTLGLFKHPNRDQLYKSLTDRLKGKTGRFRFNLLGKRVDYSARSVIVVGPTLKVHQCGLPKPMAFKLFYYHVFRKLLLLGLASGTTEAKRHISEASPAACTVLESVLDDVPVLLNRAPTLHRLGFQSFQARLVRGRAILLHPLVCTGFNADFDGDQMGVHVPLSPLAKAEAQRLMTSAYQILGPAHGEPMLVPSQDMVLGCYVSSHVDRRRRAEMWKRHMYHVKSFSSVESVVHAYDAGLVDLHSPILLRVAKFESDVRQSAMEVQIETSGQIKMYFKTCVYTWGDPTLAPINHIFTTVGRVLINADLWEPEAF